MCAISLFSSSLAGVKEVGGSSSLVDLDVCPRDGCSGELTGIGIGGDEISVSCIIIASRSMLCRNAVCHLAAVVSDSNPNTRRTFFAVRA